MALGRRLCDTYFQAQSHAEFREHYRRQLQGSARCRGRPKLVYRSGPNGWHHELQQQPAKRRQEELGLRGRGCRRALCSKHGPLSSFAATVAFHQASRGAVERRSSRLLLRPFVGFPFDGFPFVALPPVDFPPVAFAFCAALIFTASSGVSAGPPITSPVALNRDP